MVWTSSIKNFEKTKTCYFQMPTIFFILELKEVLKPVSKKVPMSKFWFKTFLMFCLAFPENAFKFVTEKLQETENFPSQILRTFVFDLKVALKPFFKKRPLTNFEFKWFWRLCLAFPKNYFNLVTQKFAKI